ncbi:MAG: D-aminoacyl-tRNA deacylase [Actinomycetota bacterium]|nr:D-tyrosyl-tRNA(Tyr) deacylase [Actinomycetota bacterium]
MRSVLQRVSSASVEVDGEVVGSIHRGVLVLVACGHEDDVQTARRMADKIARMRIFPNTEGKMDLCLADAGGAALIVSQFTLLADTAKGRRPSFVGAAPPQKAEPLINEVVAELRRVGLEVSTGTFGAHMDVSLVNDGPVTFVIET